MSKKVLEKEVKKYLIATNNNMGQTVYLHSLHNSRWEITDNIEVATKTHSRWLAEMVLENYHRDVMSGGDWIVLPVVISYSLVNETETDGEE